MVLGAYLQSSSLSALGGQWLPVLLVSAATLAISLAAGALLARATDVDPPTAALGLVAGGASGIVGMARELGADDRLVAFMQYLRVLVVVLLTPLLVAVAFPGHGGGGMHAAPDPLFGTLKGWLITLALAPLGALLGGRLRVPAASLMGPMIASGIVTLAVPGGTFAVPALLREAAFIAIGLQVGLRFTIATMRQVGRLLDARSSRRSSGCSRPASGWPSCSPRRRRSRCWTPTSRRRRAVCTRCWPSRSARGRTRRSSSPSRDCGCS